MAPCALVQLIFHGGEEAFAVANADGYLFVGDLYFAFADVFYFADGDDIAPVCSYEFFGRELLGDGLQGHERQDRLAWQVYFYIIIEAFHIQDLLEVDLYHLVVGFDEDIAFLQLLAGQVVDVLFCFVDGFEETVVFNGFEEVVDGVDVKAVHGVFTKSGGKDYRGILFIDDPGEFDAVDIGHLDIEEQDIHGCSVHHFLGFEGVGKDAFEVEEIDLGNVFLQDLECQGFVVDGYSG